MKISRLKALAVAFTMAVLAAPAAKANDACLLDLCEPITVTGHIPQNWLNLPQIGLSGYVFQVTEASFGIPSASGVTSGIIVATPVTKNTGILKTWWVFSGNNANVEVTIMFYSGKEITINLSQLFSINPI